MNNNCLTSGNNALKDNPNFITYNQDNIQQIINILGLQLIQSLNYINQSKKKK